MQEAKILVKFRLSLQVPNLLLKFNIKYCIKYSIKYTNLLSSFQLNTFIR